MNFKSVPKSRSEIVRGEIAERLRLAFEQIFEETGAQLFDLEVFEERTEKYNEPDRPQISVMIQGVRNVSSSNEGQRLDVLYAIYIQHSNEMRPELANLELKRLSFVARSILYACGAYYFDSKVSSRYLKNIEFADSFTSELAAGNSQSVLFFECQIVEPAYVAIDTYAVSGSDSSDASRRIFSITYLEPEPEPEP